MDVLRTRIFDLERRKRSDAEAAERRGQVGSGDRSERIRTYNFPQGRLTDHRINLTLYKLPEIVAGIALDEVIDPLRIVAVEESQIGAISFGHRMSGGFQTPQRIRLVGPQVQNVI